MNEAYKQNLQKRHIFVQRDIDSSKKTYFRQKRHTFAEKTRIKETYNRDIWKGHMHEAYK